MAFGLPVEGDDGPFLGDQLATPATCDVSRTVGDAQRALRGSDDGVVVLVHAGGLAVGEVDGEALEGQADDVPLLEVLRPVPSTVRPSVTSASVAEAGGGERLVTTSDGRLLGRAVVEAADDEDHEDHEGHDHDHDHDHEGHDHGPSSGDEPFEQELTAVLEAVAEHFGDREPPPDELRSFLRDRLVAEGRSAEDADRFLDDLKGDEPASG